MATTRILKIKVFTSLLIRNFFLQGCLKSFGVIISDTIDRVDQATLPIVAFSFAVMSGLNFASAPIALFLVKAFKTRTVLLFGGFLVGSGFVCQGLFADKIWLLYLCNVISGIGFGLLSLPLIVALAKCFQDSFGSAMTGINVLSNVGMAVLPPLLEYWRDTYGLVGALVLFGALLWNTSLPGVLVPANSEEIDETDGQNSTREDSTTKEKEESLQQKLQGSVTQNAVVGHPVLIFLYGGQFCSMFILMSWAMFLLPYGVDKGYRQSEAVFLSTVGGCGVVAGRVCMFLVFYSKRHNSLVMLITPMVLLSFTLVLFIYTKGFLFLEILSLISGASAGYISSWMFAYTRYVSCLPHFETASALSMVVVGASAASSGLISGFVHDIRGTYNDVFMFLAALAGIEALFTSACIICNKRWQRCNCDEDGTK